MREKIGKTSRHFAWMRIWEHEPQRAGPSDVGYYEDMHSTTAAVRVGKATLPGIRSANDDREVTGTTHSHSQCTSENAAGQRRPAGADPDNNQTGNPLGDCGLAAA